MEVGSSSLPGTTHRRKAMCTGSKLSWEYSNGGLAQLARALAWHARGHRFDPDILHVVVDVDVSVVVAAEIFDIL